jgi:hypothetical protein
MLITQRYHREGSIGSLHKFGQNDRFQRMFSLRWQIRIWTHRNFPATCWVCLIALTWSRKASRKEQEIYLLWIDSRVNGTDKKVFKIRCWDTYIQYLLEPGRTLVFSFNCPRRENKTDRKQQGWWWKRKVKWGKHSWQLRSQWARWMYYVDTNYPCNSFHLSALRFPRNLSFAPYGIVHRRIFYARSA